MVKYILLFFGFVLGIGLLAFGFFTWLDTAVDCDDYLDMIGFGDFGLSQSEAIELQKECEDDKTLGWVTMITGTILTIGTIIIGILAFIWNEINIGNHDN